MANKPADPSMDDILSSIRETVEADVATSDKTEETQVAEQQKANITAEDIDDILDLTDVVEGADTPVEAATPTADADDLVDVEAFAGTGESKPADAAKVDAARETYQPQDDAASDAAADEGGAGKADAATADDFDIDIDGIMAEVASEGGEVSDPLPEAEPKNEVAADAPVAEQDDNADESATTLAEAEGNDPEDQPRLAPKTAAVSEAVASEAAENIAKKVSLRTVPGPTGLQVAFPAEILAEALRPLVTDWLEANLADIVERLVKEELSKLADR